MMNREQTDALNKINRAGYGYETRIPIHFLLSFADRRSVEALIARTALKQELETVIKNSTKNNDVINARRGYNRLVEPLDYIANRLSDLDKLYNIELPYQTSNVTFKIIKEGGS